MKGVAVVAASIMSLCFSGCFTGVESTPKITAGEVRKVEKVTRTPEQDFLSDVRRTPPAEWDASTVLMVTDDKIALALVPGEVGTDSLAGHTLSFAGFSPAPSVTGRGATFVALLSDRGDTLHYVVDAPVGDVVGRERLDVPFTVETALAAKADMKMRGRTFYITVPTWIDASGAAVDKFRHVPVTVVSVSPGDSNYPLKVNFRPDGVTEIYSVYMTVGGDRTSTRNFDTLFAFDNPRGRYPRITDRMWGLIVRSQLAEGMTRDEARLALGAPDEITRVPTNAAAMERWSYGDGVYLIFEDGLLTRFRK